MATKYSTQFDNAYNNGIKVGNGDINGRVKSCFAEFEMAAAVTAGDVIEVCKVPAGARILEAVVIPPAFGVAGELDLGYLANGVDAASQNGLIDAIVTGAIKKSSDAANNAGLYKVMGAETIIALTGVTTTTAVTGTFKVLVKYALV